MNILVVHEVDWLKKVVFDIHSLSEALSLRGHQVYAIDYENTWRRDGLLNFGTLKTREVSGVARALPGAAVCLRRPGFIRLPGLSRLSAGVTHYLEIQRTIRDREIDAILLYGVATNGLQTTHLARRFGIPVVFRSIDILNQLVPYPLLRPVVRSLERRVYSAVDWTLTLTPKLSRYVIGLGAREERVSLLPVPVDTALFHPAVDSAGVRRKWGFAENDRIVLFMGTLFDFSGLDTLVPLFPEVVKQVPDAKLLIVGDGPQRPRLDAIIRNRGLQGLVTITGFEPYHTMPQYINLATVCVNTFRFTEATRDIFPGKTVQFLACGRALIATALPGMTALIPGEDQGIVYVQSVEDAVGEIIALLKSGERRQKLERAALSYVTQVHSHDTIVQQLELKLEEVVGEKHRK